MQHNLHSSIVLRAFILQSSLALWALLLFSCSKQYPVREVPLGTRVDSISYAMAYMTGQQAAAYTNDTTGQYIVDYMSAYEYALKTSSNNTAAYNDAYQMGLNIKEYERKGLYFRKGFPLLEPVLLQGYVNGLYMDSLIMNERTARTIYDEYKMKGSPYSRLDQSVLTKRCPAALASVALASNWDSLNYMVGWINGYRVVKNLPDSLRSSIVEESILGVQKALTTSYAIPTSAARGYGFGVSAAQWKKTGKIGPAQVVLNLDVFEQGLINGLHKDTTMMTMPKAIKYMRSVRSDLFYDR